MTESAIQQGLTDEDASRMYYLMLLARSISAKARLLNRQGKVFFTMSWPEGDYTVPIGKAAIRREGRQVSLISYGLSVHHCLEASEVLSGAGIDCEVVDLRTIKPLDTDAVLASVRKSGKVCIVHEDNLIGGVGAEIAAIIAREAFEYLDGPIYRVAAPDVPSFPYSPSLEDYCLPSPAKIVAAVTELAAY